MENKEFDFDFDKVLSKAIDMANGIFKNVRDVNLRDKLRDKLNELREHTQAEQAADPAAARPSAGIRKDKVIHRPAHYGSKSGQDVIDVAEDFGIVNNAYKFNMLKYLLRGGKKPGNSEIQDMKKIREYCDRYIETLEADGQER